MNCRCSHSKLYFRLMKLILIIIVVFVGLTGKAQGVNKSVDIYLTKATNDSLELPQRERAYLDLLHATRNYEDSVRVGYFIELANLLAKNDQPDRAVNYCDSALKALPNLGFALTMKLREKKADIYLEGTKPEIGLKQYFGLLDAYEKRKFVKDCARINAIIGIHYKQIGEDESAIYHLKQSVRQAKEVNDKSQVASSLMSLGNAFKSLGRYSEAEPIYLEAIKLAKENGFKRELAGTYNNIGSLKRLMKKNSEAMKYYKMAVEINLETNNRKWLSYNYNNIGNILMDESKYQEALSYFLLSLEIKKEIDDVRGEMQTYSNIADTYKSLGRFKEAFEAQKKFSVISDSIANVDKVEESMKLSAEFQTEKREAEIERLNLKNQLNQEILKERDERILYQNFLGWLMGVGIALMLTVAIVLWRSAMRRKRTNEVLEQKNEQIRLKNEQLDEKNREIMDSINYAKRIQGTILPSEQEMGTFFTNYSILYLPKDIVSGDFYVFAQMPIGTFFGVVDCTGHGVPGAMVSLVGSSFINKAIKEKRLTRPELVLDYLDKTIPRAFERSEEMIRDGMDLGLCFVNSDKTELLFSGANHKCWVLNRTVNCTERTTDFQGVDQAEVHRADDLVLLELKGDRRGIGEAKQGRAFSGVSMKLVPGDKIILFTDGYADQFGGKENKKFKNAQLRQLLFDNVGLSPLDLKVKLFDSLMSWKGEMEQVDDVCVFVAQF